MLPPCTIYFLLQLSKVVCVGFFSFCETGTALMKQALRTGNGKLGWVQELESAVVSCLFVSGLFFFFISGVFFVCTLI